MIRYIHKIIHVILSEAKDLEILRRQGAPQNDTMMDMLAVIKTGGKQYLVKEGTKIKVEKLEAAEGSTIKLDEVLLAGEKIGSPLVEGASVEAKVLKQARHDKIRVVKFKAKSRYTRTRGHRQHYTELEISKINA